MKILFVSHLFPWPLDSGGALRRYYLIDALARRHEVTLVTLRPEGPTAGAGEFPLRDRCARVIELDARAHLPPRDERPRLWAPIGRRLLDLVSSPLPLEARYWNGARPLVDAFREVRHSARFDTVWVDFTKGLGAPVGAVLAGSQELIEEAWRFKQMMGGAFRQSGIVAAGCLYALDHHVERLAEDHDNARYLAEGLAALDGVTLNPEDVESNIVIFEVDDAPGLVQRLADRVELQVVDPRHVRAVTHLDVGRAEIERALEAFADAVACIG